MLTHCSGAPDNDDFAKIVVGVKNLLHCSFKGFKTSKGKKCEKRLVLVLEYLFAVQNSMLYCKYNNSYAKNAFFFLTLSH